MQNRCLNCLREQYAIAVALISRGEHPCVWCGYTPPVMTEIEYRKALAEAKANDRRETT